MSRTKIDWCDWVTNEVWGCTGGCPYCYAREIAKRFGKKVCGRDDFVPTWIERNFQRPIPKSVKRVFVNSMSDVADWKPEWLARIDQRMRKYPEHLFLMLTKRPWQIDWFEPAPNAMLGYSATDQFSYEQLLDCGYGNVSFLSIEPMHGPIPLGIFHHGPALRWLIVGSETGNRRGKMQPETRWLSDVFAYSREKRIPLFFKESLRPFWIDGYRFPQEYPVSP